MTLEGTVNDEKQHNYYFLLCTYTLIKFPQNDLDCNDFSKNDYLLKQKGLHKNLKVG